MNRFIILCKTHSCCAPTPGPPLHFSEEEKGKLHWTFISWALPGKLDPYEMPQFGRKPEISSSDGIPCGNFVSLLRASKLVDGKRVTVSMLHNIFENYHDKVNIIT